MSIWTGVWSALTREEPTSELGRIIRIHDRFRRGIVLASALIAVWVAKSLLASNPDDTVETLRAEMGLGFYVAMWVASQAAVSFVDGDNIRGGRLIVRGLLRIVVGFGFAAPAFSLNREFESLFAYGPILGTALTLLLTSIALAIVDFAQGSSEIRLTASPAPTRESPRT